MHFRMWLAVVASIAGAAIALGLGSVAQGAPVGAAQHLSITAQACQANGTVTATLQWTPSGLGQQRVDLATNASFSGASTGGPFSSSLAQVNLTHLAQGATYYIRVRTATSAGTLNSDTLVLTARSCVPGAPGPISKPTNLTGFALSPTSVRLSWQPGAGNVWYCVDMARSLFDLVNTTGSWRNFGCWTTSNVMDIGGLACGTTYFWLVYAWNATSNVKSDASVVHTASCAPAISAPTGLHATPLQAGTVQFSWSPGVGNIWYCVDTAKSPGELLGLFGSWRNHGCWTTSNQLVVSNLDCGTTYFWLVYSWNHTANVKSSISTFQTLPCPSQLQQAPIESVNVVKVGANYRADIVAALPDACHTPHSHLVERVGNQVRITVWNHVAPGPCAFVYSTYQLGVNLGSNFTVGQTYQVIVNNQVVDTFVAN